MPKVYLSSEDQQRDRLAAAIYARMRVQRITTTDLGECWMCTQQNAARRVRLGIVSVIDLYKAQDLLKFTDAELAHLIRGDRDPVIEYEKAGRSDQRTPAKTVNR